MATSKAREIEILEYKISECDRILNNWMSFKISEKKIKKMENKKARYEDELAILKNS